MPNYLLTIIVSLFISVSYGQQYYSADIVKKADSILGSAVGQRIFQNYYHYDIKSYYEYKTRSGKTKWSTLTDSKKTKGMFVSISVRYNFCINKFNVPCNTTYIEFDSLLNVEKPLNVEFIPQYVLNYDTCNFISDIFALAIANKTFKEKGVKPVKAYLEWDYREKLYVWTATNFMTIHKDAFGKYYGECEIIRIDGLTGKIISREKASYAPFR